MDTPRTAPRKRGGTRLARIKIGVVVASAAAFAAIGGAIATGGGDGATPSAAVQQGQTGPSAGGVQEPPVSDADGWARGEVFSQDQDSGAPMMRSGGS